MLTSNKVDVDVDHNHLTYIHRLGLVVKSVAYCLCENLEYCIRNKVFPLIICVM